MLSYLTRRFSHFTVRRAPLIVIAFAVIAIGIFQAAPRWNEVAYDGDFDYLPPGTNSAVAARVMDAAFQQDRARSQIVLVLSTDQQELSDIDLLVGDDLLRRLYHRLSEACYRRALSLGYQGGPIDSAPQETHKWLRRSLSTLDRCINIDKRFYERFIDYLPDQAPTLTEPRMAIAYYDRSQLLSTAPMEDRSPDQDLQDALTLVPSIDQTIQPIEQRKVAAWDSLLDILSWDESVLGSQLSKPGARLAVLQLESELAATGNVATLTEVHQIVNDVRKYSVQRIANVSGEPVNTVIAVTGSAAVGGETLIASRDAIRYTESITVIMILLILIMVYRAPLLVAIPMLSIGFAVIIATSLVALLAQLSEQQVIPWLDMRVFTTSRIFIIVILFGAGTDYCLFLISRLREEASQAPWVVACRRALIGVTSALMGSAMTTIVGLGMLWFADFGKYHYTGPIIAICLLVGLIVSLTLVPALLTVLGPIVFWPNKIDPTDQHSRSRLTGIRADGVPARRNNLWSWIALKVTRRPGWTLFLGILALLPPSYYGAQNERAVTYDLTSELDESAPSRRGTKLLQQHFDIGEINPVTVLMVRPEDHPREELRKEVQQLTKLLYQQSGVVAVRNANDPLGDFPPDRGMGLLNADSWRRMALQKHRVAQDYFFSNTQEYQNRLVRMDLIMVGNPFEIKTQQQVVAIHQTLLDVTNSEQSKWSESEVYLFGTTPSIIDLRSVTIKDNQRIKIAVVLAVFLVLLIVIRRFMLCAYLIFTVLLSYYATLGITAAFFGWIYGDDFVGLDWKLPLFLFVILVAVGQDYNVYLVTRIVEEQRQRGWLAALRHALSRTGGIITACGVVMAATFFSMTASAWLPPTLEALGFPSSQTLGLRGIVELGFALGLGVLIDTFYVRTVLVPSFVSLMGKFRAKRPARR